MNSKAKTGILVVAFVLLLILALGGYRLLSFKTQPPKADSASSTSENSKSSSKREDSPSSMSSKIAAPNFTVRDEREKTVSFSDFYGKPVVLNFWASWCPPCKAEMPDYEKMYRQYGAKNVVFMMVNLTDGSRETVAKAKQFLKENKYTFPAYFDVDQDAADVYGISSIPDSIFIDKNGTVVHAYEGMIDAGTMKNSIEAILK